VQEPGDLSATSGDVGGYFHDANFTGERGRRL
jgi:hypothetical protein